MSDSWVRCAFCGRKIHYKKIWDSIKREWVEGKLIMTEKGPKRIPDDEPHICYYCERIRKGLKINHWIGRRL